MEVWKRIAKTAELKAVQEEMLGQLTEIFHVFSELGEEAAVLSEKWKGNAADTFFNIFFKEVGEAKKEAEVLGKVITALVYVEKEIEEEEKKVKEILSMGGR